ncbi:MAG: hypothetical protein ACRDL7_00815 [Gaiellaceae bacterium]
MTRLVLAAVIGSVRRLLAIFIAVLAIAGAAYLGSHKLSNPSHYEYGGCPSHFGTTFISPGHRLCSPPTLAAWQIPLAVVIALGGLGAAFVVVGERPRRRTPEFV